MPQSLSDLEQRRELIARRLTELGDLRPGSITATSGRCGKPECHCHQPGQPGHGPNFRLTYKVDGKTISEDRKSTRLNSSHVSISYAVFCLKKKKDDRSRDLRCSCTLATRDRRS